MWSSHNDAIKKAEQILECNLHEEHSICYPWGWANKVCVYVTWLSEKVGLLTRKKFCIFLNCLGVILCIRNCDFKNCLSEYLLKGTPCIQFSCEAVWIILCCNNTVKYLHSVILKSSPGFMVVRTWTELSSTKRWVACATSLNSTHVMDFWSFES